MRDGLKRGMHYKPEVCVSLREYGIIIRTASRAVLFYWIGVTNFREFFIIKNG